MTGLYIGPRRDQPERGDAAGPEPRTPRPQADGIHPYAEGIRRAWCDRLTGLKARPWRKGDAWNSNCFVTARKLVELANSPWAGYSQAQAKADFMFHAPHDQVWDEREKCWDQGRDYAAGASLPEPPPGGEPPPPDITEVHDLTPDIEADFWQARPLLRHIRDAARARMVAPWAVLGVTLARVLALTPWTVHLPPLVGAPASLNYAVALVAPSGGGKGGADGCAREAILMPHVPEYRIGSGEAIAHCLKHRLPPRQGGGTDWNTDDRNALINLPEVDKLTAQASRTGATIMSELRSAWSGEALGHVTADASRRIPVERDTYRLALVLGVQPGRAGGLLDDADGGFPQRLVFLPAYDPGGPDLDELPDMPETYMWRPPSPTGVDRTITVCETAARSIREARWRANRGEGDPLDGHLLLAREKTAAALGILEGRYTVTDDDWHLAGVVIDKSSSVRESIRGELAGRVAEESRARAEADAVRAITVEERTIDAAVKRVCTVIVNKLRRSGDWVTHSNVRNAVAGRDRQHFEDAMRRLFNAGQIEHNPSFSGSTHGAYRWVGGDEK